MTSTQSRASFGVRLWCARHAPAVAAGLCYGRHDVPVDRTGEEAARGLLEALPDELAGALSNDASASAVVVWSSPVSRCRDVAAHLASHWRVRHVVDERLHEIDFGAWEGRTWSDIERHDDVRFQRWMAFWKSEKPTGGESVSELEARVTGWLSERALEGTSGASTDRTDLVLIGHAGVIRALRVLCEGLDWDTAMSMATPHVTWSSFVLSPKRLEEIRSESQVR